MWEKRIIQFVMKWLARRLAPDCEGMSVSGRGFEPHSSEFLSRKVMQPDNFRKITLMAEGMLDLGRRGRLEEGRTTKMLIKHISKRWEGSESRQCR